MISYTTGQQIPESYVNMSGGITPRPSKEETDLLKQQKGMNYIDNAAQNLGIGQPSGSVGGAIGGGLGSLVGAGSTGAKGGSLLEQLMAGITGMGPISGSRNVNVQSDGTSVTDQTGDTFGAFTNFINNLLSTAMSGRIAAGSNATKFGSDQLAANTQGDLANLSMKKPGYNMGLVGSMMQALKPGFAAPTLPEAPQLDTSSFTKGIPVEQMYAGGVAGGSDPLGIFGTPAPKPPVSSQDLARKLGDNRGVKRMDPYAYGDASRQVG